MNITLRDEVKSYEKGTTVRQIAESISEGLARVAVCERSMTTDWSIWNFHSTRIANSK